MLYYILAKISIYSASWLYIAGVIWYVYVVYGARRELQMADLYYTNKPKKAVTLERKRFRKICKLKTFPE